MFAHFILPSHLNTVNSYNMQLYVYIVFYDHAVDLMLPSPKGKANRLNSCDAMCGYVPGQPVVTPPRSIASQGCPWMDLLALSHSLVLMTANRLGYWKS